MQAYKNSVDGQLIGSEQSFRSKNPSTGEVLGMAPVSSPEQVKAAIAAAKAAQPLWAALPDAKRKDYMMKLADVLTNNTDYLAQWITREQGKPLGGPGSMFEMQACVAWTQVPASLDLPMEVVFEDDTRRDELRRQPHGVVAAIAPWNWPLLIAIWQIIPSLRTGNTVVIKPSEHTTLGTLEMVRLMNEVLPKGVLNTVSGAGDVGALLLADKDIDKIMFTGSSRTGAKVLEASANSLAPVTLELGGNDAAIVLADADPQAIAEGLFWGAFINMGQTCACAKRLYVHESIHDAVVLALREVAAKMPMGNGMESGVVLGPIQNRLQFDKVVALVEDARAHGATIVCGGAPLERPGNFYPITLVTDITDGARLVDEEQFGPVLPIIKYNDVDDAIRRANRLDVGLGASVWSSDLAQAHAVATRLQAGTVWINQHGAIHPMVPFGGTKGSGYGVEFGLEGLKAATRPQVISIPKTK